ncbi:MAG: hypothetical protein BACC_04479 [Bacteroides sp.]
MQPDNQGERMSDGVAVNTHSMYRTVRHIHLDSFVYWVLGEFPDEGLNLVECQDGRWFVEVDSGSGSTRFDRMPGVSCPNVSPFVEPVFHADEASAMTFALECIRKAYPTLSNRDLHRCAADYFEED